jgi:2-C-methyl-D-erythritol 4-phosphate cytidylyltransferase
MNAEARRGIWAVVPAAGSGSRIDAALPKQYLSLAGRMLAEHTLEALLGVARIRELVVAIATGDPHWASLPARVRERVRVVSGGADRAASVLAALGGFSRVPADDDWVLVHDMARPCVRTALIENLIETLEHDEIGGLLAIPVVDTLKRATAATRVQESVEREGLWRAQTPQMFRFGVLRRALVAAREAGAGVTDESMAVERLGLCPRLVMGSNDNIKVTVAEDLALAEYYLAGGA